MSDTAEERRRPGLGSVRARVAAVLPLVLVLLALLVPSVVGRPSAGVVWSLPLEALLAAALLVIVPGRLRSVAAIVLGLLLGLSTMLRLVDLGFFAALARPFDLLFDWTLFGNGFEFLKGAFGVIGAVVAVVAAVVVAVALLVALTWSVVRLSQLADAPSRGRTRFLLVAAAAVLAYQFLATQVLNGLPPTGASLAYARALTVRASLDDQRAFAAEVDVDAFADARGADLLTGLRGKDVVLALVESYGRDAVEDPLLAAPITKVLEEGNRRLSAAGFTARSAYLTSSTFGGGSWLAHGTLSSGLWVDNEQRYRTLVTTDRFTLNQAFSRAGWRTVAVSPGTISDWPEGAFFGYEQLYDARTLGYRGPSFSWATMPDQYTLAAFERLERRPADRPPVMAEISLVSSHAPWSTIPEVIDWAAVGDGSVYDGMGTVVEPPSAILTRDPERVRADYRRAIEYSLQSLISYVETHGDDDLVMIFLGDHQPNPIVTGETSVRDVPITIVTRDRAVLERISAWRWSDGLTPGAAAPVWRMDAFRDRFLTAYGSQGR